MKNTFIQKIFYVLLCYIPKYNRKKIILTTKNIKVMNEK